MNPNRPDRPNRRVTTMSTRGCVVLAAVMTCVGLTGACVAGDPEPEATPKKDSGAPTTDSGASLDTTAPTFDTNPPTFDTSTPPPTDTGGSPTDTFVPPPVDSGPCSTSLIDDMESDGGIKKACGRMGFWYTYNDASAGGVQSPTAGGTFVHELIPGGRGTSTKAAHTTGSGFTTWGAGMAFDLNNPGGTAPKGTYSAAAYTGITFFAKAATSVTLRLNISTPLTEPGPIGSCTGAKCSDHFGKAITIGAAWAPVSLTFAELAQLGWGTPATFDKSRIIAIQFQVDKGAAFDFWIDDISFTP